MKIIDVEQGSAEWLAARRCAVTGTKLEDVMGTPLASIQLIAELIAEEGTEQSKTMRATDEMERGSAEEPFAVRAFEERTGKTVERVGICVSDTYDWLRYSPDGLIKVDGKYREAIEIKNPNSSTVIFNKIANLVPTTETGLTASRATFQGIPPQYKWQVIQGFLVLEELETMHFVTYDARFIDPEQKMYIVTVHRADPAIQEAITEALVKLEKFRAQWLAWKEIVLPTNF